ncbi:putative oxidoreductase [Citrus sinensis]|uniref:uncharacterized oxidoreductase At4g09670 n=1 Tax=Citrus sinensis TaxID=2711 RepID=UPI00219DFB37|nr:uncharacterized oxidoreductase At4g09670 [Citrus sinensis]KAH9692036.1 putative oxidoreductase [Citrus sinensis]
MATESQAAIRFGIIGAADIARKLSRAITLAPNAVLSAVASRSLEKATNFAKANNFPPDAKVYGSYEALLDDKDIDAVYLPLPTSMHVKWAIFVAQKKKHLLMEKPVALNVAEFDVILKACEENGVQLMDGTMWVHNPRTAQMKEFVSDPQRFGQLRTMHSCFSFAGDAEFLKNDIRVKPDLDGLGALGDAGWYGIRSILWANDYELPKTVIAMHGPVLNEAGVILSCGASLHWDDGRVATFSCSFLANMTMDITATGTNGSLQLHDFIIPFREEEASYFTNTRCFFNDLVTGWEPLPSEHVVTTDIPQEACMVREFSRLVANIKNGSKPEQKWPIISRKTQLIIDAVKTSIERGFEPIEIKW